VPLQRETKADNSAGSEIFLEMLEEKHEGIEIEVRFLEKLESKIC
jgi:hypothetical protein